MAIRGAGKNETISRKFLPRRLDHRGNSLLPLALHQRIDVTRIFRPRLTDEMPAAFIVLLVPDREIGFGDCEMLRHDCAPFS
ncbi:hypothetical protein D3C71_1269540 [compost metagenome]